MIGLAYLLKVSYLMNCIKVSYLLKVCFEKSRASEISPKGSSR